MVTADDIRAARRALNESQSAFGARIGVDQCTVSRWETRGPPAQAFIQDGLERALAELRRAHPQEFACASQLADSCVKGGAGEAVAGHDASLADGSPTVTANAAGGFA